LYRLCVVDDVSFYHVIEGFSWQGFILVENVHVLLQFFNVLLDFRYFRFELEYDAFVP
jgi:hypothetical protein